MKNQNETGGVEFRYRESLELYRTTDMTLKAICSRTGVSESAFKAYLFRHHRELMLARHGLDVSPRDAAKTRLRNRLGQSSETHAKYRDAIIACDDAAYIEYNVSQIARIFKVSPIGLSKQLRNHFPDVVERREKERHRLGIGDNRHRGATLVSKEQYAEAVAHLCESDDTIKQTALLFNLSYSGLREHLLHYHKDLVRKRRNKRINATGEKTVGALTGNGNRHIPSVRQVGKYEVAARLYTTTPMTYNEVVAVTDVSVGGLRNYIRTWCEDSGSYLPGKSKRYLKSASGKYAAAINCLRETRCPTAEIARKFGLNPDVFRMYLHEHEPQLAASNGMTRTPDGRLVSAASMDKYREAIRIYESTTEPLKSIARRLGLKYNSISGFVRRNFPDAIQRHNGLVAGETAFLRNKGVKDGINMSPE